MERHKPFQSTRGAFIQVFFTYQYLALEGFFRVLEGFILERHSSLGEQSFHDWGVKGLEDKWACFKRCHIAHSRIHHALGLIEE